MKIMIKDLKPNQRFSSFFLLESLQIKISKKEKEYLIVRLSDKTGRIIGFVWENPKLVLKELPNRCYVKVTGIVKSYNDSLTIDIYSIKKAEHDEIDMIDFIKVVPQGIKYWYQKLISIIKCIEDANCIKLINSFLTDQNFFRLFINCPGGISVHHNYFGGLLQHTVNTMEQGLIIAEKKLDWLDKDILLTGCLLHDIGKVKEFSWNLIPEYTTEGLLLGHISLGIIILEQKLMTLKHFPKDIAMIFKHLILSHHGKTEYGSPVNPATPEAILLNLIEGADAKINHLDSYLSHYNLNEVDWSDFDKHLNTRIYLKKFTKTSTEIKNSTETFNKRVA